MKKIKDKAISKEKEAVSYHHLHKFDQENDEILKIAHEENLMPEPDAKKCDHRKKSKVLAPICRLENYKASVCLLLRDLTVLFDNNQAAMDIRMVKVKTKVSECFRNMEGAKEYLTIMSYVGTARKQGINYCLSKSNGRQCGSHICVRGFWAVTKKILSQSGGYYSMKKSMFTFYFMDEREDLVIYNSYIGREGIRVIENKKKDQVMDWLENPPEDCTDELFIQLYNLGYFLKDDVDEKKRRENLMQERLCDSELDLTIHTTKACNFRCQYCSLDFESKPMTLEIQNRIIKHVRKNIGIYSAVTVDWFGGEPLLEMEVIDNISKDLIDICKRARKRYSAFITTNGYLLNDKNLQILLKNRVYGYTVTIDGLRDIHDRQRFLADGTGTFDMIINNLLNIKNNYKSEAIHVNIRSNVTTDILGRIDEYYDFFNKTFGEDKRFSFFVKPVGDWGGERVKKIKDRLIDTKEVGNIYDALAKKAINTGGLKFTANTSDLRCGGVSCPARNRYKYTIGVEGNINKCDESRVEDAIGFIDENGNLNIDLDKHMAWISHDTVLNKRCDECFFSCNCFGSYCPKWSILKGDVACALDVEELKSLILLYVRSEGIGYIEEMK